MTWEPVELDDSVTVWGAGHRGPAIRDNLLSSLKVDPNRTNIALVHASDISAVPEGKPAHCPFTREDIERSGVDFALLGHYHELRLRPQESPRYAYPGSPEPLDFAETGDHHVLLLTHERCRRHLRAAQDQRGRLPDRYHRRQRHVHFG